MNIHSLAREDVLKRLVTSEKGLGADEVRRRFVEFGPNELGKARTRPLVSRVVRQSTHFLAILLWVGAFLAFVLDYLRPGEGMLTLGFAIVAVICINAAFTFVQEYRAEKALDALKGLLPFHVRTVRDGSESRVTAREIVPGDVIKISEGDKIPADARLIEAISLQVNNASLTGEADAVLRDDKSFPGDFIDSPNIVFAGTTVVSGSGTAVVFATGMKTEFGRIAHMTTGMEEGLSPLQKEIVKATRLIALIAAVVGLLFFVVGFSIGKTFWENFIFAIGITVALIPEGMLPTVSLALAMGSQRMAKRMALIKTLSSVETLGSVTVICTDKTGTLTQNKMSVVKVWTPGRAVDSDGRRDGDASFLMKVAYDCNNARFQDGAYRGDPTEVALLRISREALGDTSSLRIAEIPFDSDRKRMTTVNRIDDRVYALTKGGREDARKALTQLWRRVAHAGMVSPLQPTWFERAAHNHSLESSPAFVMFDLVTRLYSPYQFNPLNYNPLRTVLEQTVDFEQLRRESALKLFLSATNVRTGKVKVFGNDELSADAVLASACLPFLFQAVSIIGESYWDGGYMGNPAIYPLIYKCESRDVVIVHINPIERAETPTTARDIMNRINEIIFNSSLMREMRAIAFVSKLIDDGAIFGADPLAYIAVEGMSLGYIYTRAFPVRRYRIQVEVPGGHAWIHGGRPSAVHMLMRIGGKLLDLPVSARPKTILNIGQIFGGTGINAIARQAWMELEIRSEDGRRLTELSNRVEGVLHGPWPEHVEVKTDLIGVRPSGAITDDHPLVQAACRVHQEVLGSPAQLMGGSTDASLRIIQDHGGIHAAAGVLDLDQGPAVVAPQPHCHPSLLVGGLLRVLHQVAEDVRETLAVRLHHQPLVDHFQLRHRLLVPLLFRGRAIGGVLLRRSDTHGAINWEDRDLLKTGGLQVAGLVAQYQSDRALVEAQQFEAFNRLSAYVVHDLKNILAQQSLIVSNAEKHKHKPEFVDDV